MSNRRRIIAPPWRSPWPTSGTLQPTLDNPYGALLAGGAALAVPVIVLFVIFQRHFVQTDISAGVKG